MKHNIFIITILSLVTQLGFSQSKTFVGGEFAITGDVYDITDPCLLITTTPLITGLWGFTIGQEINKSFLIETGLIRKYYDEGFGYNVESVVLGTSSNAFNTYQIPLRLKAKINLIKERLFLVSTIGYNFSINTEYGYGGGSGGGSTIDGNDTIKVSYTVNDSIAKTFSLLEVGLGFEYVIFNGFIISLTSSYYTGFKNVHQLDIITESSTCNSHNAYSVSKGNYWNISIGVKYAFNHFWSKKE